LDYKVLVERREVDGSNYKVNRGEIPINSGTIKLEGSRAVDNAKFVIRGGHDIKTGDIISFISDDLSVDNLACSYNFYHNLRDEGGYNIDGFRIDGTSTGGNNITTRSPVYGTETDSTSRYRGHHYLDCSYSSTIHQIIRFKQSEYENNKDRINFENGREIHLHIRTPAEDTFSSSADEEQVIFSRMDSNTGIEISLKHDLSENKIYAQLKQKAKHGSTVDEQTTGFGSTNCETAGYEKDCFIRVWTADRADPTNFTDQSKYKVTQIQVDNKPYTSYLWHNNANYKLEEINTTKDIYLGADSSSQNPFKGKIYALRIYNEAFNNLLKGWDGTSAAEWHTRIWKRLLPLSTMKFGGKITDIINTSGKSMVHALGHSGVFLNTEITENMFTVGISNPDNASNAHRGIYVFTNATSLISGTTVPYNQSTLLENILDDIILNYNTNRLDSTGKGADWTDTSTTDQRCHLGKDASFEFKYINKIAGTSTGGGGIGNDEDEGTSANSQGLGAPLFSASHVRNVNRYDAGGKLIDTVRLLAAIGNKQFKIIESGGNAGQLKTPSELVHLYGADQFQILPRKVLVFESSEIPNQTYFSTNNGYRIENEGYDDNSDINEVQVFASTKSRPYTISQYEDDFNTYPSTSNGGTSGQFNVYKYFADKAFLDNKHFVTLDKIERSGTEMQAVSSGNPSSGGYKFQNGIITWGSGFGTSGSVEVKLHLKILDYEDDDGYFSIRNDELIKKNGLKSRKYIVPQIQDLTTITSLARRILGAKAFPNRQVTLIVPRMINALGIGMTTTLDHGNIGLYNEEFVVKKITYHFPKGQTVVECGDFAYDVMDDIGKLNENINTFQNEVTDTN